MKKIQTFAVTSLTALAMSLTLASCSSDDINTENGGKTAAKTAAQTVFSCGDDEATRTSINNKRAFFWEKGDKIWIYDGSQWQKSTKSDIASPQTPTAKFTLSGSYTDGSYQVLYTGYANGDTATTQYNKVTIADIQTQKAWNDGSHLGTSGDCGTATAFKQPNGTYRFSLEHKASYLLIYPYLHTSLAAGGYTLEKIEIYSDLSASNIAGTFGFDFANGLLNSDGTTKTPDTGTGKQEMTLNCRNIAGTGFGIPAAQPDLSNPGNAANHCFVVIAPGNHQLTIRYVTKKSDGTQHEFIKDIALKQYKPNGVYTFVHELREAEVNYGFEFNEVNTFYRWGRTYEAYGTSESDYDRRTTSISDGFWSQMINNNEMSWYLSQDKYYDVSTQWKYNRRDGTQEIRRKGFWFKKRQYIAGFNSSVYTAYTYKPIFGRPAAAVIHQYFYLPIFTDNEDFQDYWMNSPATETLAWAIKFTPTQISETAFGKKEPIVAGTRPDGTPWFQ